MYLQSKMTSHKTKTLTIDWSMVKILPSSLIKNVISNPFPHVLTIKKKSSDYPRVKGNRSLDHSHIFSF